MMSENKRLTSVIVDTNAFVKANSDFLGIKTSLLPSFFDVIKEKEINLLTHPILECEIEKNIEQSSLYQNHLKLKSQLVKCKDILEYSGCIDDEHISAICDYDIKSTLFETFKAFYSEAEVLNYPNPEIVFKSYFNALPPFASSGNKKNEFPDGFVIESIKHYINEHPNDILLILTNDTDWKLSFKYEDNVEICENINEAIKLINGMDCILDSSMLNEIFNSAYEELIRDALWHADCECYELKDFESIDDPEIKYIAVESINEFFTPLKITREAIILKTEVTLKMSGTAEIFDEDNSVWDSEDGEYIFREYADIEFEGVSEVECEFQINYDFDNLESIGIEKFKFTNFGNIEIECEDVITKLIDDDELAIRCLREDKGMPRKA